MAEQLRLIIVSQDKLLLDQPVESVTLPTQSGQVTVLKDHQAMISKLDVGELIYRTQDQENSVLVTSGFMDKRPNNELVVIVDAAYLARDLSESKAQEAMRQAETAVQHAADEKEMLLAEASLRQAFWELKIARKSKAPQSS